MVLCYRKRVAGAMGRETDRIFSLYVYNLHSYLPLFPSYCSREMNVIPVRKTIQPQISYLVCGTPRCGSSLLCETLKNTGIAGRPEEYFWRGDEPFWRERWNV